MIEMVMIEMVMIGLVMWILTQNTEENVSHRDGDGDDPDGDDRPRPVDSHTEYRVECKSSTHHRIECMSCPGTLLVPTR